MNISNENIDEIINEEVQIYKRNQEDLKKIDAVIAELKQKSQCLEAEIHRIREQRYRTVWRASYLHGRENCILIQKQKKRIIDKH